MFNTKLLKKLSTYEIYGGLWDISYKWKFFNVKIIYKWVHFLLPRLIGGGGKPAWPFAHGPKFRDCCKTRNKYYKVKLMYNPISATKTIMENHCRDIATTILL